MPPSDVSISDNGNNMSGWQMPEVARKQNQEVNDKNRPSQEELQRFSRGILKIAEDLGKYTEEDVMQQIESMLQSRKDDKDLCRETTLYSMCDNML